MNAVFLFEELRKIERKMCRKRASKEREERKPTLFTQRNKMAKQTKREREKERETDRGM